MHVISRGRTLVKFTLLVLHVSCCNVIEYPRPRLLVTGYPGLLLTGYPGLLLTAIAYRIEQRHPY